MKKLSLILCIICLFTMCAMPTFAADYKIGIEVTNVAEDIVTISGAASIDNLVTVLILNPGKSEADVTGEAAADTAVQYFGAALSKGGKFKTDVKINTVDGGVFTVVVKTATGKYTDTFSFYPYGKKMGDVEELKGEDADALALKLSGILENYGYAKHPLFADITEKELAEEIVSQNSEYPLETPEDADVFLRKMLVLAAFNAGSEALTESGRFDYASELDLLDNDWYIDYTRGILSEEGYEKLHEEWISESYNDNDEIVAEFEELMCYYAVVYNALSGGGHVEELLEKYEEQYDDAGFKLSLIDSASGKKQLFAKLVAAKPASLSALASKFNTLFKKTTSTGGSTGGGSGSSAPVSGAGGGGYVAPATPSTPSVPTTPQTPAYPFKDMESSAWAKDAVKALYDSGVIAGRSEGIFAPSENVTRAEFVKLITEGFKIEKGDGEAKFDDVAENAWYAEFIMRAASKGIVSGTGSAFLPNNQITREDAAVIIARVLGKESSDALTFADAADASDYAKSAVAALTAEKIINGVGDNKFAPKMNLTRAQAAVLIYNALGGAAK